MYEFRNTIEQGADKRLPSVAMTFDGKIFENEISGYETLNVSGRETISTELVSYDVRYGSITTHERLPSRVITVQYRLEERDNLVFQNKFKALRKLLSIGEQTFFSFRDDPDTFYLGRLAGMEEVEPSSNTVVSSFTLLCDSPYKFGKLVTTTNAITIDTFYETPPLLINVVVNQSTQTVEVTNGIETIRLEDSFKSGDKIAINVEQGFVAKNGEDNTYSVALNSDFENFVIEKGQTVSSPQGAVTTTARERWL